MDTEHDPDLYNVYVVKIALTRQFEEEMNEIGIEDRDYEAPEEEPSQEPVIRSPIDFGEGVAET